MAEMKELPLWIQLFIKTYPFRRSPWAQPAAVKPLRESKVALVTTAGLHMQHQPPFDITRKAGDYSYRWISGDVQVQELRIAHRSQAFDHSGIESDLNLCFPLDRFRELAAEGIVGSLNERHLSFMGSLTSTGRLLRDTAPEAARLLKQDGVDLAFLAPV
jgi:D-proline reductase (dithiol) PrdB